MNRLLLVLTLLLVSLASYSQNCRNRRCAKIKSDGIQCKRCVGVGDTYCSSHRSMSSNNFNHAVSSFSSNDIPQSNTTTLNCRYAQCTANRADGNRCRKCTGSSNRLYCSSHR